MNRKDEVKRSGLAPPVGHIDFLGRYLKQAAVRSLLDAAQEGECTFMELSRDIAVCPQSYLLLSERGGPLDTPDAEFCSCHTRGRYPEARLNNTG